MFGGGVWVAMTSVFGGGVWVAMTSVFGGGVWVAATSVGGRTCIVGVEGTSGIEGTSVGGGVEVSMTSVFNTPEKDGMSSSLAKPLRLRGFSLTMSITNSFISLWDFQQLYLSSVVKS